jgi:general secretion pathway protein C
VLFFSGGGRLSCDVAPVPSSFKLPDSVRTAFLRNYERHGRRLPGAVSLLFVVLLGFALARLVWTLIPMPETAAWRPAPAPPATASAPRSSAGVDLAVIQSANLFGEYNPEPTQTDLGGAPETSLNLKLLGILASSDNERYSRALIEVAAGDERPFGVGAQVIQGTTLQAILPDRVVLSRSGKLETLRLEKDKESTYVATAPAAAPPPPGTLALAQIRDQVLQDPNKAGDYVRVQAANKDGRLQGYRIYPGKDRSVFAQAGLKPGDLVTQVNGVQLDDASKALKMLSELKDVSQLNLVVERGGQSQQISVKMN